MSIKKNYIRDFYNRIIGSIEVDDVNKTKVARDFYGRYLSKYNEKTNTTTDFYNRIIGRGDLTVSTIYTANEEDKNKRGRL